jgi:hypothetical protein
VNAVLIRATGSTDRNLGADVDPLGVIDRRRAYIDQRRAYGHALTDDYPLRQRDGLDKQATLHRLPIPRHRALVVSR